MKKFKSPRIISSQFEEIQQLWHQLDRKPIPPSLFFVLCLNLIIAPAVQAATSNQFSRIQAYAMGMLGLLTISLSIYLFVVMFQPERF